MTVEYSQVERSSSSEFSMSSLGDGPATENHMLHRILFKDTDDLDLRTLSVC